MNQSPLTLAIELIDIYRAWDILGLRDDLENLVSPRFETTTIRAFPFLIMGEYGRIMQPEKLAM